ncbi:MAG TPA: HAD-IC family P-type ATPase [Streptosporangiaceae bacterium]
MVGTGKGAQSGILIRSAEALETAHKLDTIVLDKTGTITAGKPALTDIRPAGRWGEQDLLTLVAAAEADSEHPLGAAIVAGARDRGLTLPTAAGFDSVTGKGVQATVTGHAVLVGTARLLAGAGIDTTALEDAATQLSADGKTPVLAAIDGEPAGVLAVADPVKDDSAAAITALHSLGVEVVMLTGDNPRTAVAIARQVGVRRVLAEVLPEHKAGEIGRLQAEGCTVGMAGDGIHDAPALAAADVGLAIGTGTDVAIEAADITLISGSLAGVVTAISLSRATMRNIRQNLFFALAYNGIGIPLAAGVLYPFFGIRLSPICGVQPLAGDEGAAHGGGDPGGLVPGGGGADHGHADPVRWPRPDAGPFVGPAIGGDDHRPFAGAGRDDALAPRAARGRRHPVPAAERLIAHAAHPDRPADRPGGRPGRC